MPKTLKVVLPGFYLHFPIAIVGRDRLWLEPGGVIDVGDPFVAHCVRGQEHKLGDAPAGAVPSECPDGRFANARVDWEKKQGKTKAPDKRAQDKAKLSEREGSALATQAGKIPRVDPRPRRGAAPASAPADTPKG